MSSDTAGDGFAVCCIILITTRPTQPPSATMPMASRHRAARRRAERAPIPSATTGSITMRRAGSITCVRGITAPLQEALRRRIPIWVTKAIRSLSTSTPTAKAIRLCSPIPGVPYPFHALFRFLALKGRPCKGI